MEILEAFIRQMREHREARHWTQEKAAFECAVSVEHYKKVERCVSTPSLIIAVRMARVLDIDLNALKKLKDDKSEETR